MWWRTIGPPTNSSNNQTVVRVKVNVISAWRLNYYGVSACTPSPNGQMPLTRIGSVLCSAGCPYLPTLSSADIFCSYHSTTEDCLVSQNTTQVEMLHVPMYEASFAGAAWIDLAHGGSGWEMRINFNLNATLSLPRGNSSPRSRMSPVVRIRQGSDGTITVPVTDDDNDVVRCRWANFLFNECAEACDAFPGAVLDEQRCTLQYTNNGTSGYYAVALQIEDFPSPTDTTPLSSVPLQFLVLVSQTTSNCSSKPTIVSPNLNNNDCVCVLVDVIFNESVIARSDCG